MSDDQFTQLFKYMTKRFDKIEAGLETKADKSTVDRILALVDGMAGRIETEELERLATNHQFNRHEGWIKQVGKNTKTKLVPEP